MRPVLWAPGTRKALATMPREVKTAFGHALNVAALGGKVDYAKPLKGLGSGVLEIVENHDGNTWRAVYTVRLASGIYVLHAFQKKSKSGISTPKHEMDLIRERLKWATEADRRAR